MQYASGCIHPNHRSQQQLDQYVWFFSSATHDNYSDISLIIVAKGMWWNNTMPGRENIWKRHHPTIEGKDAIVWSWTTMAMPLYLKVPFFWVRAIPTLVLILLAFQHRSRLWPHDCCHHGWLWQRCPADLWWPLAFLQRLPKQYPPTVQIPSHTQQLAPFLTPTHTGIWLGKWMLILPEVETTAPLMVTISPCGLNKSMTGHVQFWDLVRVNSGDADIVYGLMLADKQWGSSGLVNYRTEALNKLEGSQPSHLPSQLLYVLFYMTSCFWVKQSHHPW